MSNLESATFILRTSDLPTFANGANDKGSSNNASHSSFTWNNIDFRAILGDMYDKYDYFNIALVSSTSGVSGATFPSNDNKMGIIYMSGLRWQNCNYDILRKTKTEASCIGIINFSGLSAALGTQIAYNNLSYNTMSKPNNNVNLTIYYNKIVDGLSNTTTTGTFPAMAFVFKVVPCKKDEISYNNQKLF